jgi:hypothetical protein
VAVRKSTAAALLAKYGKGRQHGPTCALRNHPRRALIAELSAGGMGYSHISLAIRREYGDMLPGQVISRHLQGICACPQK